VFPCLVSWLAWLWNRMKYPLHLTCPHVKRPNMTRGSIHGLRHSGTSNKKIFIDGGSRCMSNKKVAKLLSQSRVKINATAVAKAFNQFAGICVDRLHIGTSGVENAVVAFAIAPISDAPIVIEVKVAKAISPNRIERSE